MTAYSKFNIVYRLQKWLDSVPGQTFLNYAYSWGASIVILGTLFKLTHLPGANIMLYVGMGTEVVVFFISAFDRPFDKTADGKDLPTHVDEDDADSLLQTAEHTENLVQSARGGIVGGGTIIVGGATSAATVAQDAGESSEQSGKAPTTTPASEEQAQPGVSPMEVPHIVTAANAAWIQQQQELSPEMEEATSNYVDELKKLTEMLAKVSEQSLRLTRDSEEMENLNRTLTGICKVYEMQLKGASAQIGTIDQINEQSRRMADQIAELNRIYARMIEAMTVNMRAAAPMNAGEQHA